MLLGKSIFVSLRILRFRVILYKILTQKTNVDETPSTNKYKQGIFSTPQPSSSYSNKKQVYNKNSKLIPI